MRYYKLFRDDLTHRGRCMPVKCKYYAISYKRPKYSKVWVSEDEWVPESIATWISRNRCTMVRVHGLGRKSGRRDPVIKVRSCC
jgi:hypothetical protein